MTRFVQSLAMIGVLVVGILGAIACGEAEEFDPTPVLTPKITPASGGSSATTPATEATSEPTASTSPASGEAQEFTVVGSNTLLDVTEISAKPGTITIIFKNQDGGILHNIAFYKGEDATAELAGGTELKAGPVEQTLTMTLEAGSYYYQCDAHPATMSGTLTVE